jgi:hypothetical protein
MRIPAFFKSYRLWGIAGLSLALYVLVIGVFGNIDISGFLPVKLATSIQMEWPDLPFFSVEKHSINNGRNQETYYTVPTRLLTPQEIAQFKAGKKEAKPISSPAPVAAAQ